MNRDSDLAKKAAGDAAAKLIQNDMLVGLGSGTTIVYFMKKLAEYCKAGLKVQTIASSKETENLANSLNLPVIGVDSIVELDISVDGADEIDPQKRMIKGGGGALLREKIIAGMSRERIIIVDESKCVPKLGSFPLPVEIIPFAWQATIHQLQNKNYRGKLRMISPSTPFISDNGNYIYDIAKEALTEDIPKLNQFLLDIPGVMQTGIFINLADKVFVGFYDGRVELRS
ncbi:MAG: ribose-5-phosphate isomerase RpiA [Parachlamydiaceae bacterium]|nr:ribose-5-phosphate isomerase RpiA [Parachlamydiaceae bacterium]